MQLLSSLPRLWPTRPPDGQRTPANSSTTAAAARRWPASECAGKLRRDHVGLRVF